MRRARLAGTSVGVSVHEPRNSTAQVGTVARFGFALALGLAIAPVGCSTQPDTLMLWGSTQCTLTSGEKDAASPDGTGQWHGAEMGYFSDLTQLNVVLLPQSLGSCWTENPPTSSLMIFLNSNQYGNAQVPVSGNQPTTPPTGQATVLWNGNSGTGTLGIGERTLDPQGTTTVVELDLTQITFSSTAAGTLPRVTITCSQALGDHQHCSSGSSSSGSGGGSSSGSGGYVCTGVPRGGGCNQTSFCCAAGLQCVQGACPTGPSADYCCQ